MENTRRGGPGKSTDLGRHTPSPIDPFSRQKESKINNWIGLGRTGLCQAVVGCFWRFVAGCCGRRRLSNSGAPEPAPVRRAIPSRLWGIEGPRAPNPGWAGLIGEATERTRKRLRERSQRGEIPCGTGQDASSRRRKSPGAVLDRRRPLSLHPPLARRKGPPKATNRNAEGL